MRDDLILFAKWSVINVFVVWIIWRIGSHVIWYNSIPRVLLKAIYPPGYDYLKQILNENMGDLNVLMLCTVEEWCKKRQNITRPIRNV